ncbi:type I DNA topoisomerase [Saccharospirillum alexandrii]|uniref:type I DNA topoisomerase n=1 Tax=Saccharospirillum alexandrii TaxID=2448477 RepID=UPI000FD70058|nr:type I DNA topoisomerase [Saccharospirillum alexandrii]
MGKSLVIVESPAKAKTINKYLGNDFIVKSSVGHIRDLPTSGQAKPVDAKARARQAAETRKLSPEKKAIHKKKKAKEQLIARMGIDPDNGWTAQYQVLPGKEKVVDELRRLAKTADTVYLATDLDREGEAIAWHLQESIGLAPEKYRRVVFNEITKKAINEAFDRPGELDLNRVNAQQARRFLDRVVGFMVSPLLWAKVARGLSAGRVQSVAVRLIVEREREIRAFNPEEFWDLHVQTRAKNDAEVRFEVARYLGDKYRPVNKSQSDEHVERLRDAALRITDREDKPTSSKAAPPFITSTLQQAASTRLGYTVKKTMTMAQRLYEAGHITYMRTDSTNLSQEAVASARDYIADQYGDQYLPEKPVTYGSREGAQEAHEAIRPSYVARKSADLSDMERDAQRLYELIWQRFVACQMVPAKYKSTVLTVATGDYEFKAKGRVLVFDGYTRVMTQVAKGDDAIELPDLKVNDELALVALEPRQHFTKPPARFTEASLVKELEKQGIGRPSTYASIISTIQDRGYVRLVSRRFFAEKIGDIVTDRLTESFKDLMQYQFTARLEEYLDDIATGERTWKQVLDSFYDDFTRQLDQAESDEDGMRANEPTPTDIECPKCGRPMMIRTGTTGVFLGCSGYSLPPKERCKGTLNLIPGEEVLDLEDDDEAEAQALRHKERCDKCGTAMDSYLIDEGRKLHICGNNPDCTGFKVEKGQYKIKGYDGPTLECDKCGAEMQLKSGRFGKYFGCTNDECKNTRKLLRNGEAAPPKMDPIPMPELKCLKVEDTYVLRDGAAGLFLAASQFPKNRETRPPLVKELVAHADELPEKYLYLTKAPKKDDEGRPTVIRFSRKTKEQYVMTENEDGKASGWKAYYQGKRWVVEEKAGKSAKA